MSDRILTKHPSGKNGVNIEKRKHDRIKAAILEVLGEVQELGFTQLGLEIKRRIGADFEESVNWY